ncbi:hypothetical protein Goklo_024059, partial [Gossypium klotzschianum]|nr:hypothetical protein [Gossypium klotzschianum]
SEKTQLEKGDSLTEGYASELWDFTHISVTQNKLQELKEIWVQWDDGVKQFFYCNYGDLPLSTRYQDLVPTVEEYVALLRCPRIQADKAYSKAVNASNFFVKSDLAHPDMKKRVDVFALSIYGLIIFPKVLGHVDEAVSNLFDQFDKRVTPKIDKVSYWVFSENYSPLKALVVTLRRDDVSKEKWIAILQNLQDEDVEWRAPWMVPYEILYRCGDFDWIPLLGIWGAVRYVPLLVLRQYRSRQFIPVTQRLAQCEFSYKGDNYKKEIREMSNAWNQTHRIKRFVVGLMTTPEYNGWWSKRVNDNILRPSQEGIR